MVTHAIIIRSLGLRIHALEYIDSDNSATRDGTTDIISTVYGSARRHPLLRGGGLTHHEAISYQHL
jgi:hypothetical protein